MPERPGEADRRLKRDIQRRCEADRAVLLTAQPFTARLMMQLRLVAVVDDRLPTAGTDGESLYVNARFMASRSDDDRRFILAHEVWHCALGHHRRQLGRDPERWNRACDHEVNALLHDELGYCPEDALYCRRYRGRSAEEIYADLGAHAGGAERGRVLDEHRLQEVVNRPGDIQDPDFQPRPVEPDAGRAWQQRLVAMAQQHQRQQGELPGQLEALVRRLRQGSVAWQAVLGRFLARTLSGSRRWSPPSRRHVHRGLYLPSHRGNSLDVAVAVDTSGSCRQRLPAFFAELRGLLSAFERVTLEVMEFDAEVTQRHTLHDGQLHRLDRWLSRGGGGSDVRPVFSALAARPPQALVVLTDGMIAVPEQAAGFPVIWCLTPGGAPPAEWGDALWLAPVSSHAA